ncbi:outer membrane nutrient binding protein, SusD family [Psychroflexus torquis ATCC 700755]|uniref:Outer membrane nutrient binding protein, SusD family n=1 Tax=Psychroflexus torquis (strain ATCC 700755 / CIP 106069 / ACAM 623) TaxID=313595 RepID=K4IRC0_PSYTT|nr:RagB/SusD family nutrient uptake outer membrane protein [Psychroflexus torquis]AFU67995.1 outer membrane nutrient binding protein, SusD family [Psychroflexus torquis ATCC 700755]
MKNIFIKSLIFVFTIGFLTSCEDKLDQIPFDEFGTENAFVSASDFENGIRGVYANLVSGGLYGSSDNGSILTAADVLSDNVTLATVGNGRLTKRYLHEYTYNVNITMSTMYSNAYSLIFRANQILQFAEAFDGQNKANIVAEAKALRALAHFHVVTFWGKIPTQSADANSGLGVAYLFEADPNVEPARNTVGEVYGFIVDDLTDAARDINESNPDARMGKDAVNLLLSRVYLYMGQWQNSINAANQVSTPVAERDGFVGIWDDSTVSDNGLIFSIENVNPILNIQIGTAWNQGVPQALIAEYVASKELVDLYKEDDIRKEAYIFDATTSGNDLKAIRKLFGREGENDGVVDYKIFRASEASLNRAEAHFRLNQSAQALAALNEVRTERYLNPADGESGNALLSAIKLERRLEFAFEYQRFLDIKRYGESVQREAFGDIADGSGTPSVPLLLEAGSFRFQMPLGQRTLDTNPNAQQNPGY